MQIVIVIANIDIVYIVICFCVCVQTGENLKVVRAKFSTLS
jgi:hypothetical protein